jgi:hypothetical protein
MLNPYSADKASESVRRKCIPRDADIFMIFSTTNCSKMGTSEFALNFENVISLIGKNNLYLDQLFHLLVAMAIKTGTSVPEMQHQGLVRKLQNKK